MTEDGCQMTDDGKKDSEKVGKVKKNEGRMANTAWIQLKSFPAIHLPSLLPFTFYLYPFAVFLNNLNYRNKLDKLV